MQPMWFLLKYSQVFFAVFVKFVALEKGTLRYKLEYIVEERVLYSPILH